MEIKLDEKRKRALLLKNMRLGRGLSRREAQAEVGISFKLIEKLENGRGQVSQERIEAFAKGYGYTAQELDLIREGNTVCRPKNQKRERTEDELKRRNRRFCQKRVTKECIVIKELVTRSGLSQYEASEACGLSKCKIGHIIQGRINLTRDKIESIVGSLGFTMELFNQLMRSDSLRHEIQNQCINIIKSLGESELKIVQPLLVNFSVGRQS